MLWAIGLAVVAAVIDWIAVHMNDRRIESFAKPAVMMALIAAVLAADEMRFAEVLLVAALVMSLAGDLLLLPQVDNFVGGLAAFLVGHLFYAAVFLRVGVNPAWTVLGAVLAFAAIVLAGRRIVEAATLVDETLGRAVLGYILVISVMVTLGVGVSPLVALGGVLFAGSDTVLGWNRFVTPLAHGRLATHVPYHLGQVLIVAGVLA